MYANRLQRFARSWPGRPLIAILGLTLLLPPLLDPPRVLLAAEKSNAVAAPVRAGDVLAQLATGEHLAIMRHAIAPGTGDPPGFRLDDCATQRNLSDAGRAQAARLGARLRAAGVREPRLFSGRWCRTRETARQLGFGAPEDLKALDSFFNKRADAPKLTAALRDWIARADLSRPVILVTHQVNITALTGVYPASGELLVLRRTAAGGVEVVARVPAD